MQPLNGLPGLNPRLIQVQAHQRLFCAPNGLWRAVLGRFGGPFPVSGRFNLVRSATLRLNPIGGGFLLAIQEANMATTTPSNDKSRSGLESEQLNAEDRSNMAYASNYNLLGFCVRTEKVDRGRFSPVVKTPAKDLASRASTIANSIEYAMAAVHWMDEQGKLSGGQWAELVKENRHGLLFCIGLAVKDLKDTIGVLVERLSEVQT